jgi:hypothetical protein
MGIKELKEIKNKLASELTATLQGLIGSAKIQSVISDDLETLQAVISSEIEKDTATTVHVVNILTFNVKNPDNITFSGSNRTVLKTEAKDIAGIVGNNTQIDLFTLEALRSTIYRFCLDNELIETERNDIKDAGVGSNED